MTVPNADVGIPRRGVPLPGKNRRAIPAFVEDDVRDLLDEMGVVHKGKTLFDDKQYNHRGEGQVNVRTDDLPRELAEKMRAITEIYGYSAW